jgi:hypothetical protein
VKRLVEESIEAGSAAQYLATLIQNRGPSRPDPFRKRRVLVGITRPVVRPRTFMRPAIVTACIVVAGAAGATLGHRWFSRRAEPPAAALEPYATQPPPVVAPAAPPAEEIAAPEAPPPNAKTPVSASRVKAAPSDKGAKEDPGALVDAIYALRTDHDPVRAGELLSRYLAQHPTGVLSEDALALSIEAAAGRHDPRAAEYANRYLKQFPDGRFAPVARKALRQSPKEP